MPESTCLHIQDRESGPIRVVEIPWISVRIGRAAYCEVRLPGTTWPTKPAACSAGGGPGTSCPARPTSPIFLEGRRLNGSCLLPFDVPFRVGPYCLTLRHDRAAEPDWEMYAGPAPPRVDDSQKSRRSPMAEVEPEPDPDTLPGPPTSSSAARSPSG